ncbi:ASCH domain-containing protein [Streptomyces tibetensis]|uniref:ASCH domain-containing protein n=1 Tax=Streptomyces tibetensis TaxID=2382123 RepID=UPI0033DF45CC
MSDYKMCEEMRSERRLFVPLAKGPYEWFLSGTKKWEVRRQRGVFHAGNITTGRRVELRLGYRPTKPSLWGTIAQTATESNVTQLLRDIPYTDVVPEAENFDNALHQIGEILGVHPTDEVGLIAFRIDLDDPNTFLPPIINMDPRYLHLINLGQKTTTIRRPNRRIEPGPASLRFGSSVEILVAITAVTYVDSRNLSNHDAQRDGYSDRSELLAALQEHYPDFELGETVRILEFKCLSQVSQKP